MAVSSPVSMCIFYNTSSKNHNVGISNFHCTAMTVITITKSRITTVLHSALDRFDAWRAPGRGNLINTTLQLSSRASLSSFDPHLLLLPFSLRRYSLARVWHPVLRARRPPYGVTTMPFHVTPYHASQDYHGKLYSSRERSFSSLHSVVPRMALIQCWPNKKKNYWMLVSAPNLCWYHVEITYIPTTKNKKN